MLSGFFDVYSEGFTETSFVLECWPQAAIISIAVVIRTILFMTMGFYLANLRFPQGVSQGDFFQLFVPLNI